MIAKSTRTFVLSLLLAGGGQGFPLASPARLDALFSYLCLVFVPNFSCLLLSFLARGRQALESAWRSPTGAHRSCAKSFEFGTRWTRGPTSLSLMVGKFHIELTEQVCHPLDACQGSDVA